MGKFAVVENGKVVNVVLGTTALTDNWVPIDTDNVSVGDEYIDGVFIQHIPESDDTPIDDGSISHITINSVLDAIKHNSSFTHITCFELSNISITGTVDIPDQVFSMPLMRDDETRRLVLFPVEVSNGQFTVALNFPTSGQYVYTNEQANHDLPNKMFEIDPIKIDVLRKVI